jgi:hypothetical protein
MDLFGEIFIVADYWIISGRVCEVSGSFGVINGRAIIHCLKQWS